MTRTTADWEKLLDGTTPAPWYPMRHGDEFSIVHINPDREPAEGFVGDVYGEENAHLAAAAPEAVAEVIRQDREITDLFQEVNDHHHDLLRVMEERNHQAAQIKRLQAGIKKLGSWPGGPMPITLIEDGIITKADME